MTRLHRRVHAAPLLTTLRVDRQVDLERRPDADLAFDDHVATALVHDSVSRRQAQSRPLPYRLRREEGLEDAGLRLGVHAVPGVPDRQHDARPRCSAPLVTGTILINLDICGFDREPTAVRHGIARIRH